MKKTLITSVAAFAIVMSAGMSLAHPLSQNAQRTTNPASSGFHVNTELSNSDGCDSCSDARS